MRVSEIYSDEIWPIMDSMLEWLHDREPDNNPDSIYGCYYCLSIVTRIREYIGLNHDEPLCPVCRIDSVINLNPNWDIEHVFHLLNAMRDKYFCHDSEGNRI